MFHPLTDEVIHDRRIMNEPAYRVGFLTFPPGSIDNILSISYHLRYTVTVPHDSGPDNSHASPPAMKKKQATSLSSILKQVTC